MWLVLLCIQIVLGYQIIPRHVPLHSQDELDTFPWTRNHMRLTRSEHMYIYHNYTAVPAESGHKTSRRHLGREVVRHHRKLIRTFVDPEGMVPETNHTKRGFIADYTLGRAARELMYAPRTPIRFATWNWRADRASQCPTTIYLCFRSGRARAQLRDILIAAVNRWHNALGPDRLVEFALVTPYNGRWAELCREVASEGGHADEGRPMAPWRRLMTAHAVELILGDDLDDISYSGIGWIPGTLGGRMHLIFPVNFPSLNDAERRRYLIHQMTHELGKSEP